jgi:hypothetical protein
LGATAQVESIEVLWPDGKYTELKNQPAGKLLTLKWEEATDLPEGKSFFESRSPGQFSKVEKPGLEFVHAENSYVDFDRDRLTYHMYSTEGPAFAKGDVNGDGREDLFFGGAKTFSGKLFLADPSGNFIESAQGAFLADALSEDTDALFFDADGDKDLDLFVTSGRRVCSLVN